jgi:hypothetical protein
VSKHDRVQRIRHDQIVRMRQEAHILLNELARREMRVISRAQSTRFRAVKWLIIGTAFAFLWLWQDPSTAALAHFGACFLGVCLPSLLSALEDCGVDQGLGSIHTCAGRWREGQDDRRKFACVR